MPNIISSAIVNTPPSDMLADVVNKRNKVHHLDIHTDEDMIEMFHTDVDQKPRKNTHLLPRRNWCSIREYHPHDTPPSTPTGSDYSDDEEEQRPQGVVRRLSQTGRNMIRRVSGKRPPMAYYNNARGPEERRAVSLDNASRPVDSAADYNPQDSRRSFSTVEGGTRGGGPAGIRSTFTRRPSNFSPKDAAADNERSGTIDLSGGLEFQLNMENQRGDPAGTTTNYRIIVPALDFHGDIPHLPATRRQKSKSWFAGLGGLKPFKSKGVAADDTDSLSGDEAALNGDGLHDDVDRSGTPLGGWADRQHPPVSRKPVASDKISIPKVRDSYPPATSASPKPGQPRSTSYQQYEAPPPSQQRQQQQQQQQQQPYRYSGSQVPNPSAYGAKIGADGRPARNRWRGDPYDADVRPVEKARQDDEFGYGPGNGYVVDPNRPYHDPGSPTQLAGKMRSGSWKFWKTPVA
jgi:hypothetical protein